MDPVAEKVDADLARDGVVRRYVTNVTVRHASEHIDVASSPLVIDPGAASTSTTNDQHLERSRAFPNKITVTTSTSIISSRGGLEDIRAITPMVLRIVELIPNAWLAAESQVSDSPFSGPGAYRDAYIEYLLRRFEAPHVFLEEAIRARSLSV